MRIEFVLDYQILVKEGKKSVKRDDLCFNRDGTIVIKRIDLNDLSRDLDGERIICEIMNSIDNTKHCIEQGDTMVFTCENLEVLYYPKDTDKITISMIKLPFIDNDLLAFYKKNREMFIKICYILRDFM